MSFDQDYDEIIALRSALDDARRKLERFALTHEEAKSGRAAMTTDELIVQKAQALSDSLYRAVLETTESPADIHSLRHAWDKVTDAITNLAALIIAADRAPGGQP